MLEALETLSPAKRDDVKLVKNLRLSMTGHSSRSSAASCREQIHDSMKEKSVSIIALVDAFDSSSRTTPEEEQLTKLNENKHFAFSEYNEELAAKFRPHPELFILSAANEESSVTSIQLDEGVAHQLAS